MSRLIYFTIIILVGFFTDIKGQTIHQDCMVIKIDTGWHLCVPDGFICEGGYGIDSYMGTISSKKDSVLLRFDIMGWGGRELGFNCSLEFQTVMAKRFIQNPNIVKELYDVPATNRIYIDTIHNRIATIVVPQNKGKGITMIRIIDCPSGSNLFITAKDLNAEQQNLVLEMFQTIKYSKEDKISH
jgi:hypothetical protein